MKLTEKQKNGFYIALSIFLAVGFGTVVFLIVQHFRNKNCTPNCNGKNCGTNGCKGTCGTCTPPQTCSKDQNCTSTCIPNCSGGKNCGTDGCGGTCGSCTPSETCGSDGKCTCVSTCGAKNCGSDNCGVADKCGSCTPPETCGSDGKCTCTPDCSNGKKCGDDGCGGSCGSCTSPNETCSNGICIHSVTPIDFDCYENNENPFQLPQCGGGSKLKCCGTSKLCRNGGAYYCRSINDTVSGDVCEHESGFSIPNCNTVPKCKGSTQFCCNSQCNGKDCGDDGCRGVCGHCTPPETCGSDGKCTCVSTCGAKNCGSDNCSVADKCGTCTPPKTCGKNGMCCTPDCNGGKKCGDDSCGGTCTCTSSQTCGNDGMCRNKLFVAVGAGSGSSPDFKFTIITSPDGITWTPIDNSSSLFNMAVKVKFNGKIWVVVGSGSTYIIAYSENGIIWRGVEGSSSLFEYVNSVDWNGKQWLATGGPVDSSGSRILATSSDGISWTSISTVALPKIGKTICWFKDKWILVCEDPIEGSDKTNIYIMYSTDAIITDSTLWKQSTKFTNQTVDFNLIECSDNNCVIAGIDKPNILKPSIDSSMAIYSTDGITWSQKESSKTLYCNNIQCIEDIWYASVSALHGGSLFYCWPDNNMIAEPIECFNKDPNPVLGTWNHGYGVVYDNKKFVTALFCMSQGNKDQSFLNTADKNIIPFTWNSYDTTNIIGVIDIFYG